MLMKLFAKLLTSFLLLIIHYSKSRVKNNAFTVHGKNGSFYWLVYAQRGKIEVEPKKSDVQVGGDGPYKYIKSQK